MGREHKRPPSGVDGAGDAALQKIHPNPKIAQAILRKQQARKQKRNGDTLADTTIDETRASADKDGLHAKSGHKRIEKRGDVSTSDGVEHSMDVDRHGAKFGREHITGAAVGDTKRQSARGQSIAVTDEGVEGEIESKQRQDHDDGSFEETQRSAGLGASKDGLQGKLGGKHGDQDGSVAADVTAEIGANHVEVGGEISSDPTKGTKKSIGGHVKFGKDGVEVGADASFGKGKLSFKGGYQVEADDPIAIDGGKFVVNYKVTTKVEGGAGYKGGNVGASVGGSEGDFETGSREFDSEKEAKEFQKDAASQLEDLDAHDPASAESAMEMKVGESRGAGTQGGWNAAGSGGMDGASVELSGGKQHSEGVSVERVSENEVEVTAYVGEGSALGLGAGGAGFSQSAGSDSAEEVSVTVRFDLKDPEAKAEFEKFAHAPLFVPKHGKIVGHASFASETGSEGTGMTGIGDAGYESKSSKSEVSDASGTRREYVGEASQEAEESHTVFEEQMAEEEGISVEQVDKQIGKETDSRHAALKMSAGTEDGAYTDTYDYGDKAELQVEGTAGGTSGEWNWQHLHEMTGADTEDIKAEDAGDIESSGSWKVSAGIRAVDMETFVESIMNDHELTAGPEYELQQRLMSAEGEEKMQVVTQYFAAQGHDALRKMKERIYGTQKQNQEESLDETEALQWDVELEGDKNFPGVPGRHALERKLEEYGAALKGGRLDAAVAAGITKDLEQLRERRQAVSDPGRYRDLPIGLKRREIEKIDADLEKLETLRHCAQVAGNDKGAEGEPPKDPKLAELHELRKEIGELDREIHLLDKAGSAGHAMGQAIDELRQQFLEAEPEAAVPLGKMLLSELKVQRDLLKNTA